MLLRHRRIVLGMSAMLGLAAGSAQATMQTLDGQYLQVTYDDALLPAGFGNVQLRETALNWACSDVSCALTGPLSAAVVFSTANGQPVSGTGQYLQFKLDVITKTVEGVVDPLGRNWGVVSADFGKWAIGVDIASQVLPGGDAKLNHAGQFSYRAYPLDVPPTWYGKGGLPPRGRIIETADLGLEQAGLVTLGAGPSGYSQLDEDGRVPFWDEGWIWTYSTQLYSSDWVSTSTTGDSCTSQPCLTYEPATVNVNNYFLSFDLIGTPTAVPEAGTMSMMLLGGLGLMGVTRRRRASASA